MRKPCTVNTSKDVRVSNRLDLFGERHGGEIDEPDLGVRISIVQCSDVLVHVDQLARTSAVDEGHPGLVVLLPITARFSDVRDVQVIQNSPGKGLQQL